MGFSIEIANDDEYREALAKVIMVDGPLSLARKGEMEMDELEQMQRRGMVDTLKAAIAEYEQRSQRPPSFILIDNRKVSPEGGGI